MSLVQAYEKVLLPVQRQAVEVFLYVCHLKDANNLQIGFGSESMTRLQRTHIAGPLVHEYHVTPLTDWLRQARRVRLVEFLPASYTQHPLSSLGQDEEGYRKLAAFHGCLELQVARYWPLIDDPDIPPDLILKFADAIDRVRINAWGHPADWDVKHAEMCDGRFVWMAYDHDIGKIRIGMGYHDDANEKVYGVHTYAINKDQAGAFCAHHYENPEEAIQFLGLPPRWPSMLSPFLMGDQKKSFAAALLLVADSIWPGEVR